MRSAGGKTFISHNVTSMASTCLDCFFNIYELKGAGYSCRNIHVATAGSVEDIPHLHQLHGTMNLRHRNYVVRFVLRMEPEHDKKVGRKSSGLTGK